MTFELESMTKVRVLDVRVLSSKDRKPDDQPGAQLLLQATLSSDVLAMFDGFLPSMLYRKAEGKKQGALEGMEGSELTSIGDHVKRLKWQYEQTGCEIEIDLGLGGKSNLNLVDCKVHRVSLMPRQGGSVVVQWSVDAPDLTDTTRGKLTGLKSTDIEMAMFGPSADPQQSLEEKPAKPAAKQAKGKGKEEAGEGGPWPFGDKGEKNAPAKDATGAFVAANTH